ncbi:MAG: MBOAT family O-acyltransferase [Bacteroidota bacterium]
MLFNSLEFFIFLPIVFVVYWFITNRWLRLQNGFIVLSSYVFYGWWDWRFLSLIAFSTLVDFSIGILLNKEEREKRRRSLLWLSLIVNLGFLGIFKYYNFFVDSFVDAFSFFGREIDGRSLDIILPVGISFYTFQTLSYTIDVYKRKLKPTSDFVAFAAFVCFFPQLVAGPIERATNLLPQFFSKRNFSYNLAIDGLRQVAWGLFKKIVIADNCAKYVNLIFADYQEFNSGTLLLGAFFFAFQIYGDFSGYSDIAIGISRLFGFDLKQNFAFPYFSRDIAEFWRRWHISLSTWFRDYLYIPLGGSRGGTAMKVRNTFIIFVVSGFWHGANWTFIVWGTLNALYFLPLLLAKRNRLNTDIVASDRWYPNLKESLQILATFFLTLIAWVFFRAKSVSVGFDYIVKMFSMQFFQSPIKDFDISILFLLLVFILIEWMGRKSKYAIEGISTLPGYFRWSFYFGLIILIFTFTGEQQEFIYFQF